MLKIIQSNQQEIEISRFEDIDIDSIELDVIGGCKYLRKKYSISDLPESICLGAIIRGEKIIIPNANSTIYKDDKLLIFLKPDFISKVENIFQ